MEWINVKDKLPWIDFEKLIKSEYSEDITGCYTQVLVRRDLYGDNVYEYFVGEYNDDYDESNPRWKITLVMVDKENRSDFEHNIPVLKQDEWMWIEED